MAGKARHDGARPGSVGRGEADSAMRGRRGASGHAQGWHVRRGRRGKARNGTQRLGVQWPGMAGVAWPGIARTGGMWTGSAG